MLRKGKSDRGLPAEEERPDASRALDPVGPARGVVESVAGWSVRHKGLAIAGWLALVIVAILSSALISGSDARSTDPGEAGRAQQIVRTEDSGDSIRENVLFQSRAADGPKFTESSRLQSAAKDLVSKLRGADAGVRDIGSPFSGNGGRWLSDDGRSGLVTFELGGPLEKQKEYYVKVVGLLKEVQDSNPDLRIVPAGDRSLNAVVDDAIKDDFKKSEVTSLPLTLVILLVVFGSLIAAGIPLLLSATAVIGTFGLLQTVGHFVPVNSAASSIVLLIGMAVGIDYSLFYLRREREERLAGRDTRDALAITARTSGRAVVVSGLTVMVCVLGLLFSGLDVFKGLTAGTVIVVGMTVLGSVTVLPATLAALGHRIDRARIPWLGRRRTVARESRIWSSVARTVVRRPALTGGVAALVLLLVASPAFGMRLQDPATTDSLPRSVAQVDAAVRMNDAFPGAASPARVAIAADDGSSADTPALRTAIDALHQEAASPGSGIAEPITWVSAGDVVVVRVPLVGKGTDDTSNASLERLRDKVLPATLGKVQGIDYAVGGKTATPYDFAHQLNSRSPVIFVFILALAFVLMVVAFRSWAIPLVSILLNLLSIGAAYGVLTWVFQSGHLGSLLGFTSYGGVVAWLPLFMFVILFGLSMDYHIFILSRIKERWLGGADARAAVIGGISSSAGVVSSAAVIMIGVFTVFVSLSAIEYKMMGVGMAVAILVDATVVRGVLLPAAMTLLGDRAWSPRPGKNGSREGSAAVSAETQTPEPTTFSGSRRELPWPACRPTGAGGRTDAVRTAAVRA
ncbi:MMPL family transporter [Streptomyces sp. NPDC090493]|uniref:MMPL family transporter n=1 Tax=Streptomyces sp. NPDC090493 TaxID=3365964 RepID=UPI00381CBA7B